MRDFALGLGGIIFYILPGMYLIACSLWLIGFESLTTLDCQRIGTDSGKCQLNQTNLLGGTRSRNIPLESLKGAELVYARTFGWEEETELKEFNLEEVNIVIGEDRINFRSKIIYLSYFGLFFFENMFKAILKSDNNTHYSPDEIPKQVKEELQRPVNKINNFVNNKELPVLYITQDDRLLVSFLQVFLFLLFLDCLGKLIELNRD